PEPGPAAGHRDGYGDGRAYEMEDLHWYMSFLLADGYLSTLDGVLLTRPLSRVLMAPASGPFARPQPLAESPPRLRVHALGWPKVTRGWLPLQSDAHYSSKVRLVAAARPARVVPALAGCRGLWP